MKTIAILSNAGYSVTNPLGINSERKNILSEISFELFENTLTGLIGESGSGKTTLAKLIAGIESPTEGSIETADKANIQLLFQNSEELIHPFRDVISILKDVSKDLDEIGRICSLLGIANDLLGQKGISLSGGERQRVGLARILLNKPGLIILDEPFSAQDPNSQIQLKNLFKSINEQLKTSLFIISHNIEPLRDLVQRILVMHGGRIVESGNTQDLLQTPMHPYTQFLINSGNFLLKREDFNNLEISDNSPCSFFNFCKVKTALCRTKVELYRKDGRMAYCNNVLC